MIYKIEMRFILRENRESARCNKMIVNNNARLYEYNRALLSFFKQLKGILIQLDTGK